MIKSIFISSAEPYSGKSLVTLGITEAILRKTKKVAFYKPIIRDKKGENKDKNIELILDYFDLNQTYSESYSYERREVQELFGQDKQDEIIEKIVNDYKALEEKNDFVICEGSDYIGEGSFFEFDINSFITKSLGIPILIVGQGLGRALHEIVNPIKMAIKAFDHQDTKIIGVVVNRVEKERRNEIETVLEKKLAISSSMLSVIPTDETIGSPSVREIADQLDAKILYGDSKILNLVSNFQVVAMQLSNYLKYLKKGSMAITPGDRTDIIMGALQANQSTAFPHISGIILTGGIEPTEHVKQLLSGLPDVLPILLVKDYTFETSVKANQVVSSLNKNNERKINLSLALFQRYFNVEDFDVLIQNTLPSGMTPKMFIYHLQKLAEKNRKTIVLPEGNDERVLKAVEILQKKDIVDMILIGDSDLVKNQSRSLGLSIDFEKTPVINPKTSDYYKEYAKAFYELRKEKGVNMEIAYDLMTDVSYFGTMMVHKGHADGMVSGAAHTTQHTIRPALQIIKTKPGNKVVSSVFFMCLDDRVVAYGDCAINPNPNAEQLAEIAISSAKTTKRFGIEPKVAMLSYSSGDSGKGADVEIVREATKIVKKRAPSLKIEGPIQYDAAVDMEVGQKKLPNSEVAGQASVLIFPDLNTGNNTYKAVQRETGAVAIGPVLQGLNKPVNDLSRGCLVEDIVNTIIITAIQAQEN